MAGGGVTHRAACSCGDLTVTVQGAPNFQAVCSCTDCQERTGSAFGMSVYYDHAQVLEKTGNPTRYRRVSNRDRALDFMFCPICGVTVWWEAEFFPQGIGIAGILLGPGFEFEPKFAVWAQSLPDFAHYTNPALPVYSKGSSDGPPTRADGGPP